MSIKNNVIAVVGPTSSGKSDLTVKIAQALIAQKDKLNISGAEIISADSRQVYKGFDLSSGKVTESEMRGVVHHCLDIASPKRTYTTAQFKRDASRIINGLHKKNIVPIVCGGTGFWIDTLLYGYRIPDVKPNPSLRKKLSALSTEVLYKRLVRKDPRRAKTIDPHNKIRLIRALEIIEAQGSVPPPSRTSPYSILKLGIATSQPKLHNRIKKRIDVRIKDGMIDEIAKLHKNGLSYHRLENFGLEFKWIAQYLQNKLSLQEMKRGLYKETVQYTKRQMTWFKRDTTTTWIQKRRLSAVWQKVVTFLKED